MRSEHDRHLFEQIKKDIPHKVLDHFENGLTVHDFKYEYIGESKGLRKMTLKYLTDNPLHKFENPRVQSLFDDFLDEAESFSWYVANNTDDGFGENIFLKFRYDGKYKWDQEIGTLTSRILEKYFVFIRGAINPETINNKNVNHGEESSLLKLTLVIDEQQAVDVLYLIPNDELVDLNKVKSLEIKHFANKPNQQAILLNRLFDFMKKEDRTPISGLNDFVDNPIKTYDNLRNHKVFSEMKIKFNDIFKRENNCIYRRVPFEVISKKVYERRINNKS